MYLILLKSCFPLYKTHGTMKKQNFGGIMPMNITVCGAGPAGLGMAAVLIST